MVSEYLYASHAPYGSPDQSIGAKQSSVGHRGIRILLIQTQGENAGAQQVSHLVGAGLAARGFDVRHLYFFRKSAGFSAPPNTTYCAPERPRSLAGMFRLFTRLAQLIRSEEPDVILSFQHYGNVLGGLVARAVSPAPVIANQVSARLTAPAWLRLLDQILGSAGLFHRITVNSNDLLRDYASTPVAYRRRLVTVPQGFDYKRSDLDKHSARRRFGLPVDDGPVLGCVARLHPLKQIDTAIRAIIRRPGWRLALAGQGPDEPRLRRLASTLGVSDRVHFVGEISPAEIGNFLAAIDVFVFPSAAETFGLAAVEAASAGVPVVANDLPVLREVLASDGEPAAVFVPVQDSDAFTAAIEGVMVEGGPGERLRAAGRRLGTRYSVDAMVEAYVGLVAAASQDGSGSIAACHP